MIAESMVPSGEVLEASAERKSQTWSRRLLHTWRFLWKWTLGALSCQTPIFALIGAGWGYQMARRSALKTWWKASAADGDFRSFARNSAALQSYARTPNWVLSETRSEGLPWWKRRFHALWRNLSLGFRAWAHSLVFLAIPSGLMMFSWYSGWDNSFNKGYEQFHVGAVLGWIGIGLFILALFYLPMAQARFAVTQESRVFYQFRLIRGIIRQQWVRALGLIAAYAAASLPLLIAGSLLGLLVAETNAAKPNRFSEFTPEQALAFLKTYYFYWGFYVFGAFVALRCLAARLYARGLARAVRSGAIAFEDLNTWEREAWQATEVSREPEPPRAPVWRWGNGLARVFLGGVAAVMLWLAIAVQGHVTQFFSYQPEIRRWVNHPLIQIPWFRHLPGHLTE